MKITTTYPTLRINAPELKRNKLFSRWINNASTPKSDFATLATWHRVSPEKGASTPVGEYSDIFLWKDKGDDGSNSDMPPSIWKKLCKLAGANFEGVLWISFLG